MQFKTGRWTAKTDKCASIYQGNTSLSFNIRAPGDFTVHHDDKVSKFHKDGKVSGKKIRIKSSSYNWISGTYTGPWTKWNLSKNGLQNLEHGRRCIMVKSPNYIGF